MIAKLGFRALALLILCFVLSQCSSATPPVSIPAPTIANITASPDGEGSVYVVGGPGAVTGGYTVEVYVEDPVSLIPFEKYWVSVAMALAGPYCNVTANADGSFACSVQALSTDTLCIKQVSDSGQSSPCGTLQVKANGFAHKLSQIMDVSVDEFNKRSVLLGKDSHDQYWLKIFDDENQNLYDELNLENILVGAQKDLTSVVAKGDTVFITDIGNEVVHEIDLLTGALDNSQRQCVGPGIPYHIRIDRRADGGASHPFVLVCLETHLVEVRKQASSDKTLESRAEILNIQPESVRGFSSFIDESWFILLELSDGSTEVLIVEPPLPGGNQLQLEVSTQNLIGAFRSFSSGQIQAQGIMGNRLLTLDTDNTLTGYFDELFNFQGLTLGDNVTGVDLVCKDHLDCSEIFVLTSDGKIESFDTDQTLVSLGETDTEGLDSSGITVDEAAGKVIVMDAQGQSIYWYDIADF